MSTKIFEVPFDKQGNMLHGTRWVHDITWREVLPFHAYLTYDGYEQGRSAMTFYWTDQNSHRYPMFLSDFDHFLRGKTLAYGNVFGTWEVVKRSGYFGIRPVPEPV